jgi:peptide/nickel transport system substrate-binding protein
MSKQVRFIIVLALLALFVVPVAAQDMTYSEAPMLAEQVAAGELPAVEERLPAEPLVVEPLEIGVYGGTWDRLMTGSGDAANVLRVVYEPLVRWTPEWDGFAPGVARDWEISEDGTEFTFFLNEGVKWSDGTPFTADDIMFWYEDVAMNEDLSPAGVSWMIYGGEMGVVEKIDDFTVKFSFATPAGLFLDSLAHPNGLAVTRYARHYFEQFHASYVDEEALNQMVTDSGLENWMELFAARGSDGMAQYGPDVPTLNAWQGTTEFTGETTVFTMVRNPYYWKVDPEGNQYPYIDEVRFRVIPDRETMTLQAAAGEVEMQSRHIGTLQNRPFFFDNQAQGDYSFVDKVVSRNNSSVIHLNQTSPNPVMREIFQNKDFRVALSHAIDRQEIIDTLYLGLAEPMQVAPLPQSNLFNERLATQYLDYDPELANQMLDEAGFAERNDAGIRLGPDGEPISFVLIYAEGLGEFNDLLPMIQEYWAAVGVELLPRGVPRAAYSDTVFENQHDAAIWTGNPAGIRVFGDPRYYLPANNESLFALAWAAWGQNPDGPLAEEPTSDIARQQIELYQQLRQTVDEAGKNEIMAEILELSADAFWVIGISTPPISYAIVRNNFFNVPDGFPAAWEYPDPGPTNTFTYYIVE